MGCNPSIFNWKTSKICQKSIEIWSWIEQGLYVFKFVNTKTVKHYMIFCNNFLLNAFCLSIFDTIFLFCKFNDVTQRNLEQRNHWGCQWFLINQPSKFLYKHFNFQFHVKSLKTRCEMWYISSVYRYNFRLDFLNIQKNVKCKREQCNFLMKMLRLSFLATVWVKKCRRDETVCVRHSAVLDVHSAVCLRHSAVSDRHSKS